MDLVLSRSAGRPRRIDDNARLEMLEIESTEAQFDANSYVESCSDFESEDDCGVDKSDEFLITSEGVVIDIKTGEPVPIS